MNHGGRRGGGGGEVGRRWGGDGGEEGRRRRRRGGGGECKELRLIYTKSDKNKSNSTRQGDCMRMEYYILYVLER